MKAAAEVFGVLAAVDILVHVASAQAAVLCARPRRDGTFNSSVRIREVCRPGEVQLNPTVLDLQGPPGPQGEPGVCPCASTTTATTSSTTTTLATPSCAPTDSGVAWSISANASSILGCSVFSGTYGCQVTAASPICHIGNQDYQFVALVDPMPRLRVYTAAACMQVLLDPQGNPTDSVSIGTADPQFTASGTFNPYFLCVGGTPFCGINGSFTAVGTCP